MNKNMNGGALRTVTLEEMIRTGYEYEPDVSKSIPKSIPKSINVEETKFEGYKLNKELSTSEAFIYRNIKKGSLITKKGNHPTGEYKIDTDLSTSEVLVYFNDNKLQLLNSEHVVIVHRGTANSGDAAVDALYAVSGKTGVLTTARFKRAQVIQLAVIVKYDHAANKESDPKKKSELSIVSTIGHSLGGLIAKLLGEGTFEIIIYNAPSRPSPIRAFKRAWLKEHKHLFIIPSKLYTPVIRIRTVLDPVSNWDSGELGVIVGVKETGTNIEPTSDIEDDNEFGIPGVIEGGEIYKPISSAINKIVDSHFVEHLKFTDIYIGRATLGVAIKDINKETKDIYKEYKYKNKDKNLIMILGLTPEENIEYLELQKAIYDPKAKAACIIL